jgi:hypothetical protein
LKDWQRINFLLKEQMDFRDSRLPPGTYANMMAQKAATSARAKSAEGSKKGATPKSGRREKVVEITPGMQDGKRQSVAQDVIVWCMVGTLEHTCLVTPLQPCYSSSCV